MIKGSLSFAIFPSLHDFFNLWFPLCLIYIPYSWFSTFLVFLLFVFCQSNSKAIPFHQTSLRLVYRCHFRSYHPCQCLEWRLNHAFLYSFYLNHAISKPFFFHLLFLLFASYLFLQWISLLKTLQSFFKDAFFDLGKGLFLQCFANPQWYRLPISQKDPLDFYWSKRLLLSLLRNLDTSFGFHSSSFSFSFTLQPHHQYSFYQTRLNLF